MTASAPLPAHACAPRSARRAQGRVWCTGSATVREQRAPVSRGSARTGRRPRPHHHPPRRSGRPTRTRTWARQCAREWRCDQHQHTHCSSTLRCALNEPVPSGGASRREGPPSLPRPTLPSFPVLLERVPGGWSAQTWELSPPSVCKVYASTCFNAALLCVLPWAYVGSASPGGHEARKRSRLTGRPQMRMRSVTSIRCGEVNKPVLIGAPVARPGPRTTRCTLSRAARGGRHRCRRVVRAQTPRGRARALP